MRNTIAMIILSLTPILFGFMKSKFIKQSDVQRCNTALAVSVGMFSVWISWGMIFSGIADTAFLRSIGCILPIAFAMGVVDSGLFRIRSDLPQKKYGKLISQAWRFNVLAGFVTVFLAGVFFLRTS